MSEQEAPSVSAEPTVEPYFGIEGVERAMGYEPLDLEKEQEQPELTIESALELRKERQESDTASHTKQSDIVTYSALSDLDPKITVTAEEAAAIRSQERLQKENALEEAANEKLRAETDEKRALAEADGIIAKANAEPDVSDEIRPFLEAGLDHETATAVSKPAVRAALEDGFQQIEQSVHAYTAGLDNARLHMVAALGEIAPHLAGLEPAQFEQGLAILAEVDRPAFDKAMNVLQRANVIAQAQQQVQQQHAQQQRQQFEATRAQFSKQSDEALGPMSHAEKLQMADELVSYVEQFGISREALIRESSTNIALHHPAFQKMASDAIKYQRMMAATKPHATKATLPVQRPGTARPATSSNSSRIQDLQRQLTSATGDRALKIGAQIQKLRRGK